MSTRCAIGMKRENGEVAAIYCHNDGYPEGVGAILGRWYRNAEKVEALLKVEVPEKVDLTGYVKKDLFDKTASELAEAKKTAKAKMSEEEQAADNRRGVEQMKQLLRRMQEDKEDEHNG